MDLINQHPITSRSPNNLHLELWTEVPQGLLDWPCFFIGIEFIRIKSRYVGICPHQNVFELLSVDGRAVALPLLTS